ncbi:hypothetical protein GP486_002495 [Trichoglossum hirsutum]|uniref:DUF1941 family protein n=1 Tax=Trichoglossum hirsutum TaxID=265104 RepID=A0A9P8LF42_9PEZI|nr:hypothetical protein GP486_002495 [Trichoglossum hirsutum]
MAGDAAHTNTPGAAQSATAAVDRVILLLKSKDDTSKFVGLAVLKSILDNQQELRRDPVIITRCWAAISPRFLDRLLRARESERKEKEEARNMVDLAAGVIHVFTLLLPSEAGNEEKLLGSSSETAALILQTLLTFASGRNGAERLLAVEDWSPLVEIAPQQQLAVDVLRFAFINGAAGPDLLPVRLRLDKVIPVLVVGFRDSPASPLLELLADLFTKLPLEAVPLAPVWLKPLSLLIQRTILARPTFTARKSCTILCAALLQFHPKSFPALLFRSSPKGKQPATTESEPKPFAFLFISLVLIDIRASFPSLLELLASPDYSSTAERLAAGFDVVAAFVGFLLKSLDEEVGGDTGGIFLQIEPDLLLKLRRDIAETMGSTIEFLRDRWDGAALGFHENSRTLPVDQRTPLSLTWGTLEGGMAQDHLTLAAVRTLALWLREDESDTLRQEASGIMDVLLGLYDLSSGNPPPGTGREDIRLIDFRPAVLTALEGILATDGGVEAFQETDGWGILWQRDLSTLLPSGVAESREDTGRGIEIIRALLTIVEHDSSNKRESFREGWMDVVAAAAALSSSSGNDADPSSLELMISLFQLATEILSRAPVGLRRRFAEEARAVAERARGVTVGKMDRESKGLRDGAAEVLEGLEALGIGV